MNDDLAKRVAKLEEELAEAKKAKEPFKPKAPMPRFDPTEGMRMPPSAVKPMADLIPDVKGQGFNPNAWAQTRVAQPSSLIPQSGPGKRVKRGTGWAPEPKAEDRSRQFAQFDRMVEGMVGGPNDTSKLK